MRTRWPVCTHREIIAGTRGGGLATFVALVLFGDIGGRCGEAAVFAAGVGSGMREEVLRWCHILKQMMHSTSSNHAIYNDIDRTVCIYHVHIAVSDKKDNLKEMWRTVNKDMPHTCSIISGFANGYFWTLESCHNHHLLNFVLCNCPQKCSMKWKSTVTFRHNDIHLTCLIDQAGLTDFSICF